MPSFDALLKRANDVLYGGKAAGRSRVTRAPWGYQIRRGVRPGRSAPGPRIAGGKSANWRFFPPGDSLFHHLRTRRASSPEAGQAALPAAQRSRTHDVFTP
jgi:hypothetical protein